MDGGLDPACPFCRMVLGTEPCHRVAEDADTLAFLSRRPINPGHVLVVPKRPAGRSGGYTARLRAELSVGRAYRERPMVATDAQPSVARTVRSRGARCPPGRRSTPWT